MPLTSPRIGVACLRPDERAAFADWLRTADLEPVFLVEACLVDANAAGKGLACVIADVDLLQREFLAGLRRTDAHLPVIAVGDADDPGQRELERRGVRCFPRPLDQRMLLLAVSLAAAESRPTRRSLRRLVPRLPSTIENADVTLLDVSNEGLRVEVATDQGARLGPMFHVHVPTFKVGVTVRRVWVAAAPARGRVQCGASLLPGDERTMRNWQALVDQVGIRAAAPAGKLQPAAVEKQRLLGRIGQFFAGSPLAGAAVARRSGRAS